jgi:hypothetical protein
MPMVLTDQAVVARINSVLDKTSVEPTYGRDEYGETISEQISILVHTIDGLIAPGTSFHKQLKAITDPRPGPVHTHYSVRRDELRGLLKTLRSAYTEGYLTSLRELVHADVFADFLEMAQYLLSEGYKDPAAVMTGGVLEEHLRKLCIKHGIPVDDPRDGRPLKADLLNAELAKASAYDKLPQKNVVGWLDLRNKAAHGKYSEYDSKQVELMLESVRHFIEKYRA